MNIRLRTIIIIILTNLLIILFSVSAGIRFVKKNIEMSLETDLSVVSDIADHFISSKIEVLKLKASETAETLAAAEDEKWQEILVNHCDLYPEFIGMAVFDSGGGLLAEEGELPAKAEVTDDKYVRQAFQGKKIISSLVPSVDGMVFYLAVPLPASQNRILTVTLPGTYFSRLLDTFKIWTTGHIFLSDSEGYAVANIREHWIHSRFNYILAAQTDARFKELAATVTLMTRGETGVGYYSVDGVPRTCSYRPVSGSEEGWSLGVVAPHPESPVNNIDEGLLLIALISVFLTVIVAIVASDFIKKPFQEIAALKEAAELNSQYKSKFLATMSHEIRTPMNVILGITDSQFLNESLAPNTKEAFEKIFDSGHLLLNIINDILDLSKIESGKFDLYPIDYETLSLINDSVNMHVMQFSHKQINFKLHVDENIPVRLFGDELRIKQILNNLLSNAYKYTAEGEVELSFGVEAKDNNTTTLVISIRDTGQGMTPEQVNKLFDEYSRFNLEANRSTVGTGLGMTITRNLVQMMNGSLTVDSAPGAGSTFTIRIPQGVMDPKIIGKETAENLEKFSFIVVGREKQAKIIREPMPYGKVLVVDDMKSNLDVAKLLMAPYQLQVDTAENGFEAIKKIENGSVYDLVFMDHMMPEMDGIETTKILREKGYANPIFVLTANAVSGQLEIFLASGFDGFISKPIDLRELNDTLNKYIRNKNRDRLKETDLPVTVDTVAADTVTEDQDIPAIEIPGVNTEAALALYGGDYKMYAHILRSFVPNTLDVIEKLRNVSEETLPKYAVNIHGLKGISAGIGAAELSNAARDLETKAKSGDLAGILAENEKVIKDAENLANSIQAWFEEFDSGDSRSLLPRPNGDLLARLLKCCEEYDMNGADKVMAELESVNYESDAALVAWLRERINESDFTSVAARLGSP